MAASIPHTHCFDYSNEEISHILNTNMVPFDINSQVSDCMFVSHLPVTDTAFYTPNQEECSGFMSFCPPYDFSPLPAENRGIQEAVTKLEQTDQVKVERYSVEERKNRILRYLKKRNQRNFNKTIKYACRKTLADKRVRVRGRFAKSNEGGSQDGSQDEILINTSRDNWYQQNDSFHDDFYQMMKYDEDYWSEAAADNLWQLPF